jgi:hypothetical protein
VIKLPMMNSPKSPIADLQSQKSYHIESIEIKITRERVGNNRIVRTSEPVWYLISDNKLLKRIAMANLESKNFSLFDNIEPYIETIP